MSTLLAYVLSCVAFVLIEQVLGFILLLGVWWPINALADKLSPDRQGPKLGAYFACFETLTIAFVSVWMAQMIFSWFGAEFSLLAVILMALFALGHDLARITRALRVWHARLAEVGLDRPDLRPKEQDFETQMLYNDVGRELAYALGHVFGLSSGAYWFQFR